MVVVVVYFAYLAAIAGPAGRFLRCPPRAASRRVVTVVSVVALAAILVVGMPHVTPLIYLLVGYWLPALLACKVDPHLEARLSRFDWTLFGRGGLEKFANHAPRVVLEYLEVAYLFCYALVPIGYGWLVLGGFGDKAPLYWSTVLLASFLCYGPLPWASTRAPRAIERPVAESRSSVRKLNVAVLDRASVQWNTFPSGHTAASAAAALVVGTYHPAGGILLGIIAISIAIGSVVGRYHYAADAIAGAVIAVVAFLAASAAHGL
jgi:membrane-associated phospholipid phosphatase